MIGPLDQAPRTVALLNDAPDAGDLIHGGDQRAAAAPLESAGRRSFVRAVGLPRRLRRPGPLRSSRRRARDARRRGATTFVLDCDGKTEGNLSSSAGWRAPRRPAVRQRRAVATLPGPVPDLICVKESEWDRSRLRTSRSSSASSSPTAGRSRCPLAHGAVHDVNTGDSEPDRPHLHRRGPAALRVHLGGVRRIRVRRRDTE